MQEVSESRGKKSGKVSLLLGLLGLALAVAGFVFAYYYSWRLTAPGLPVEMRPSYESLAKTVGLGSLALAAVSVVLIGFGIRRWYRNRSPSLGRV
jgi:hypothetical protein